jgi:hypothetical protein
MEKRRLSMRESNITIRPKWMRAVLVITVIALCLSAGNSCGSRSADPRNNAARFTEDEKHRLYSAALATSESPMDNDIFKNVCRKIGIFDTSGQPNDQYMAFVAAHLEWSMKPGTHEFKREINTTENARAYLNKYLPQ